ncbi:MAG: hypothetical protein OXH97_05610, partial [Chloroflexota bacterium]|nr:hypothetical protein [Chloroflexota bacterium]
MVGDTERTATQSGTGAGTATAGVTFQPQASEDDPPASPPAVEIRNVSLWYGAPDALRNVSIDIP